MSRPPRPAEPEPRRPPSPPRAIFYPLLFAAIFAAVLLLHLPLIGLPYYWDEAGYFIPAARDIYEDGSFIARSTLSNAHPPLVMAYLALAWKALGFHIWAARAAMLAVSAAALAGLFRLAERVSNRRVAAGAVVCTALYPVFFAQSTLAHLDMSVAALTAWALVLYLPLRSEEGEEGKRAEKFLERPGARRALCIALLALACLAKETAILVPVVLCGWELLCRASGKRERLSALVCVGPRRTVAQALALLLSLAPLAVWFAYHYAVTGYVFGNPEYVRYNVGATLNLPRVLDALWRRLAHVTVYMNLWALTGAAALAMFFRPRRGEVAERPRIAVPVQLLFAALVLAHVVALSLVGGAVLARYLLPVLPLVVLVSVSTLWRRVRWWPLALALVCGAFAYRSVVNPPYSFPWEENLAYRDFVLLHRDAARFLSERHPRARVLTTWPATDELKNPYFGYLGRPLAVFAVENFRRENLERAAARKSEYDVAFLYSTHGGLGLEDAAALVGGRVAFHKERKGQWVAVVEK
ncbi:MAG TPA: glycosyltransferase family 39 protein [Pyrinomonadaceae bacterium]|nr:glycosyltransferase family 39 protein [Pyrinomonadaceae bacterium]